MVGHFERQKSTRGPTGEPKYRCWSFLLMKLGLACSLTSACVFMLPSVTVYSAILSFFVCINFWLFSDFQTCGQNGCTFALALFVCVKPFPLFFFFMSKKQSDHERLVRQALLTFATDVHNVHASAQHHKLFNSSVHAIDHQMTQEESGPAYLNGMRGTSRKMKPEGS